MGGAIFVLPHTPLFVVEELFVVTLILSFHLRLGFPSGLFAFGFPSKPLQAFTFPLACEMNIGIKLYIPY
jgi:hypothetical protein